MVIVMVVLFMLSHCVLFVINNGGRDGVNEGEDAHGF